jgi:hypothetical protein
MDWAKLMEKVLFGILFTMSILFLYVIFGFDIPVILLLCLIYFKIDTQDD